MKIYIVLMVLLFAPVESGWANERPPSPMEKPAGSGVIVHRDGYVLTAHHVVANAKRITIVTSGEFRVPAVLVSVDAEHDLALLKVETVGLSEALLGYAGAVKLDQEVIAVGFQWMTPEQSMKLDAATLNAVRDEVADTLIYLVELSARSSGVSASGSTSSP